MSIDGVNSAMTALQFAQARSSSRAVETSAATTTSSRGNGRALVLGNASRESAPAAPDRLVMPATFHWGYRPTIINGKRAAKRAPQFVDSTYWSMTLDRLG